MTSVRTRADNRRPAEFGGKFDRHLVKALSSRLRELADPVRAPQQQAYMKSAMPYLGIATPALRRSCVDCFRNHELPDSGCWQATILTLWRTATYREERYAALELLRHRPYRIWYSPALLPMLEELITTGAWWDFVDSIAPSVLGSLLRAEPATLRGVLKRWSMHDDLWLRRSAILAQLKFKSDTDRRLLFSLMKPSLDSKEFFLRKAIGWALREYSKTNPDAVIDYVSRHQARLSGLSRREALKVIERGHHG